MIADAIGSQAKTLRLFIEDGVLAALDVGCATGAKTAFIARHVAGTIGIDPNPKDVREAHNRYGGRHLDFLVARAQKLCFADGSFDAVFFNESLHHVPIDGQEAALREGHRVLAPRGRMLITEPIHGSGSLGQILKLYLDEAALKQHAVRAIEAVMKDEFTLRSRQEIEIQYRFRLSLPSGHTLLIAHNIDIAPRIEDLREGDTVAFYGEYEWNERGGVIHWTHHDPRGRHADGWLRHNGITYQ